MDSVVEISVPSTAGPVTAFAVAAVRQHDTFATSAGIRDRRVIWGENDLKFLVTSDSSDPAARFGGAAGYQQAVSLANTCRVGGFRTAIARPA